MGLYNMPGSQDMDFSNNKRGVKIDHKSRANLMIGMIG